MIDIRNGELADLWPDETSPEFKSISYGKSCRRRQLLRH